MFKFFEIIEISSAQKFRNRALSIYSFSCGDCAKEYLGQSKRKLGTRLRERQKLFQLNREGEIGFGRTCVSFQNHYHWRALWPHKAAFHFRGFYTHVYARKTLNPSTLTYFKNALTEGH